MYKKISLEEYQGDKDLNGLSHVLETVKIKLESGANYVLCPSGERRGLTSCQTCSLRASRQAFELSSDYYQRQKEKRTLHNFLCYLVVNFLNHA